jgi:hypothetical protein
VSIKHVFLVTVETDTRDLDAPTVEYISNEIQNNLEYEAHRSGITGVSVQLVKSATASWIMENVIID